MKSSLPGDYPNGTQKSYRNDHWSVLKTLYVSSCLYWLANKSSLIGVEVKVRFVDGFQTKAGLGPRFSRCVRMSVCSRVGGIFPQQMEGIFLHMFRNGWSLDLAWHVNACTLGSILNPPKSSFQSHWIVIWKVSSKSSESKTFTGSSSQFQKFKVLLHGRRCPWKLPAGSWSLFRQSASLTPNGWDDMCDKFFQSLFSFIMLASFSEPSETSP